MLSFLSNSFSRPKRLVEVVFQDEVINILKKSLDNFSLPHLLFYGPPGTGKTSTIIAISRQLFGPQLYSTRVLELNASDERGINVIRNKVKKFAKVAVGSKPQNYPYPCPKFKIIVLDEADSMTKDAQAALRRTMEQYSKVTRFCLICNYITKIIEPVTSRCAKYRFKPVNKECVIGHLKRISRSEKIIDGLSEDVFEGIYDVTKGDMRRSITVLQTLVSFRKNDEVISRSDVMNITGNVPDNIISDILLAIFEGKLGDIEKVSRFCIRNGFSSKQILSQLHDKIVQSEKLNDLKKSKSLLKFSAAEKMLIDGADEYLVLLMLSSYIWRMKGNSNQDPMNID